jgi:hypothetical protein
MKVTKQPLDYYECFAGTVPFVVIDGRHGRLPLQRVLVTAAGIVELHCNDGVVETLGSSVDPVNLELLRRIRTHHEGLLLVEAGTQSQPHAIKEQMLSARFR